MAKPGDGGKRLSRLLVLMDVLATAGNWSCGRLAEKVGVSEKTIKRDIAAMEEAGIRVVRRKEGKEVYWSIDKPEHVALRLLKTSHFLALRLAMGGMEQLNLGASSIYGTLEDLAGKIEGALGQKAKAQLRALDNAFYSYEKHVYARAAPDVFWPIVTAIMERRLCRVSYKAVYADKANRFQVLPLKLFTYNNGAYLMAYIPRYDGYITLNLQRLQELQILDESMAPPADFDPEALDREAFGVFRGGKPTTYRLRFDAAVAPYIRERCWHQTQALTERRDGGVELRFRCDASEEVNAWVRSWGHHVEVLAPAGLRREMAALGRALAERYAGA